MDGLKYATFNTLSAKPTKWSNTLKQFVGRIRRMVWVCLTILWDWRLKGLMNYVIILYFFTYKLILEKFNICI